MEKDSRTKLIEAATALFAAKGLKGVSIRELAEAASVNSALISYYFGGKDGLYMAVIEELFSPAAKMLAAFTELSLTPPERIEYYAKAVVAVHQRSPYLLKYLHSELNNPTFAFEILVEKYINKLYGFIKQAFADGVSEGYFSADLEPSYAAISLAGIMNFYFMAKPIARRILPEDTQHDEKYIRQAVKIYLNGIRRINYE